MKRRALHLRQLIDSSEDIEQKAKVLQEYARLIWLICIRSKA